MVLLEVAAEDVMITKASFNVSCVEDTVLKCYYRFHQNFHGPAQLNSPNSFTTHNFSPQSHLAHAIGDLGAQFFSMNQPPLIVAMLATPEVGFDSCWYPDSGATNHVTANVNNLTHKSEFHW